VSEIVYEFGGLRLNPLRRTLTGQDGALIELPPRAMEALLLLVERRGQLLDKSTLTGVLWPDTEVTENSLDQIISLLRRALRPDLAHGDFIATERGRGFRFTATVEIARIGGRAENRAPAERTPVSQLTDNAQAYQLYLQARALSTRPSPDNLRAAFELARRALLVDPTFVHVQAFLAMLRTVFVAFDIPMADALTLAERDARHALSVDSSLARGHQALGNVLVARGAWREAAAHYDEACRFEEDPDARVTRIWQLTQSVGYLRLSLQQATELDTLAPSQPLGAVAAALACCLLGLDHEARHHADTATALGWPRNNPAVCDIYALLALRAGRFREAAEWMIFTLSASVRAAGGAETVAALCAALETGRRVGDAVLAVRALVTRLTPESFGSLDRKRAVLWFTMLGALDEAFGLVDRSLDHFALSGMIGISWGWIWMPEMRRLRADARFAHVVERLHFADYWSVHGAPDEHQLIDGRLVVVSQQVTAPSPPHP
jgi:DNA-binding winged helix-turn-helix (wHTH) protein